MLEEKQGRENIDRLLTAADNVICTLFVKMNLAIRGVDGRIEHREIFHNDRYLDFALANTAFVLRSQA